MTTIGDAKIHTFCVDCFNDPMDDVLKELEGYMQETYPDVVCTSFNSLLIVRIIMQMVHLVYTYYQIVTKVFDPATIVIPTGGGGHVTSGLLVQQLGFPITLISACNEKQMNVYKLLTGQEADTNAIAVKSVSPAIDIVSPYNFERWLFIVTNSNGQLVAEIMEKKDSGKNIQLPEEILSKFDGRVLPFKSSDEEVLSTMQRCWKDYKYVIDPHTATGFTHFFKEKKSLKMPTAYMGCASPMKFPDELSRAGVPVPEEYQRRYDELDKENTFEKKFPYDQEKWLPFLIEYVDKMFTKD